MPNCSVLFVYVSEDLEEWLKNYAKKEKRKLSNAIRLILEDFKEKKEKEKISCILPQ